MSLNIKDEHIRGLARRVTIRTGLSQTRVVEWAVVELLASLEAETAASGLDQFLDRVHTELTTSDGALNSDVLYGPETRLPQ